MTHTNSIVCGDNLEIMKKMQIASVDLVYLDPPFLGSDQFSSESSSIKKPSEYLAMLRPRFNEIHRILKGDGSLFCHVDLRTEKIIQSALDEVFDERNLLAKIIWQRGRAITSSKYISHTYDVIMFYGKTERVKFFPQYLPYSDDEKESQYKYIDEATGKRYRLVGLTRPNSERSSFTYEFMGVTRNWRFSKQKMQSELKQGRIIQSKPGAVPLHKQYIGEGKPLGDIWTDLPIISSSKEMTGYPTQKPLALLERIINMTTQAGDIVFDPFCGSGTSLVAAEKLDRHWLGVDISPTACQIASQRIEELSKTTSEDLIQFQGSQTLKEIRNMAHHEFESWVIAALSRLLSDSSEFAESIELDSSPRLKIYSIAKDNSFDMELGSKEKSIPIMAKQRERIEAREISNFAVQLKHHDRRKGLFVAFSFSKNALDEIGQKRLGGIKIIPIRVKDILAEKI